MQTENPTADSGASITDRIARYLDGPQTEEEATHNDEPEVRHESEVEVETPEAEVPTNDEDDGESESQVSLTDVARFLGVEESALDVSDDGAILVKTKIDGKEGTAKFNDLVKSYQLQGHVDAKAREAADTQKALQERVQQFEAYARAEVNNLTTLASIAQQELMRDVSNIDWQQLARDDPAEYVAKHAEFQARQSRVNQLANEANQRATRFKQEQEQNQQKAIQSEMQRVPTLIPEWNDLDVARKEGEAIEKYALGVGFTEQDVASVTRADMLAVLRKAWLYDQGKAKAAVVEKQVRSAPKLVKPGTSIDASQRKSENVQSLLSTVRKSGGKRGIAEYLVATGKA